MSGLLQRPTIWTLPIDSFTHLLVDSVSCATHPSSTFLTCTRPYSQAAANADCVPLPPDVRGDGMDVVVANILAGPLTQLAPTIASLTKTGGLLALSGVLAGQEEHILEAYSPYYEISVAENNDGWLLLTGVRA